MTKLRYFIAFFIFSLLLLQSCGNKDFFKNIFNQPVKSEISDEPVELLFRNRINLKNNSPFYILKKNTYLYFKPDSIIPSISDLQLNITDIVFPLLPYNELDGKFYGELINGDRGWVDIQAGISLDYTEDENLYFFSDAKPVYYLSHYIENKGKISNSYRIILYKNIIPMLLGNFKTPGWFYPVDVNLAIELANHAVSIAQNGDTFFYASTMYDNWRINELVISMNLLADAYHKNNELEKAAEIHNTLIKRYFWKRSDNTQIGGLNSTVKLLNIYIDSMLQNKNNVKEYGNYRDLIISTMLTMDDDINFLTLMDNDWNQTAFEWMIDILSRKIEPDEFIRICDIIRKKTESSGVADLINVYKAIKLYETGKKEEGMKIFVSTKSKIEFQRYLDLNDWLSEKQIIPDSIIYQYERF